MVSGAHFDQWWKGVRRERPDLLTFDPAMLTHDAAAEVTDADYPEQWVADGGLTFDLGYHFEPGAADDGITIDVPVAVLNRVGDEDFSWNVPGLREELVTELLRSLPKHLRVNFVPAPNTAREFLAAVPAGEESLLDALERYLRSTTGVHVPREAWGLDSLAPHLRPTYRVVDDSGREQARGKDLTALKAPLRPRFEPAMAEVAADSGVARTGETTWAFGEIDATATWTRAGHEVEAFPGLVDEGGTVGLQVFGGAAERDARHRLGLIRLLLIGLGDGPVSGLVNGALQRGEAAAGRHVVPLGPGAARRLPPGRRRRRGRRRPGQGDGPHGGAVRRPARRAADREQDAASAVRALLPDLLRVLDAHRETDRLLSGRAELALLPALSDMRDQVARLVPAGFVGEAGATQLRRYPVYLAAVRRRREQLGEGGMAVVRDREWLDRVQPLQEAYLHQVAALPAGRPPGAGLRQVRWQLEEFRVSLWAPQLGTAGKVSDVRIRKLLDA